MDATKCGAFIAKLRNEREMTQKRFVRGIERF